MPKSGPIWSEREQQQVFDSVGKLEDDLGLPKDFCINLLREDDWSFVIKLHALFEAAVTHLLVAHLGQEVLLNVFAKIDMSKEDTGKIAFAKALDLLDADQRSFVSLLSRLRNSLVHDVKKVTFDLAAHVQSLDTNQKGAFVKAAGYELRQSQRESADAPQEILSNPKTHLWGSGVYVLAVLAEKKANAELKHELRDSKQAFGDLMRRYADYQRSVETGSTPLPLLMEARSAAQSQDWTNISAGNNLKKP